MAPINFFLERARKSLIFRDRFCIALFLVSFILNGFIWYNLVTYFRLLILQRGVGSITLHYNIYFGPDYFGSFNYMYAIPAIGLAILIINAIISIYLYNRLVFISYIILGSAFIFQLIIGWSYYLILRFNI